MEGRRPALSWPPWLGGSPARSSSVARASCRRSSRRPTLPRPGRPRSSSSAARPGSARAGSWPRRRPACASSGWLVLEGGTVALGDDGLPFGPIVEALRVLVRDVDADRIAAAAGPSLPELARLVPELSTVAGDGTPPAGQVEWLQTRVFEGILRLLGRLGEGSPVLLVVEDLHWADRSTRDLLAFLARNARDERLFIVGTFRTDELHRRHPLTAWLAEAERQPRVERIDLVRFERDELVELLTAITGAAADLHARRVGRPAAPMATRSSPRSWWPPSTRPGSAASGSPRPCAASCWSIWPRPRSAPAGWSRSPPSPAARSTTRSSPRSAA